MKWGAPCCLVVFFLLCGGLPACAALSLPPQPSAGFEQHLRAALPLQAQFADQYGRRMRLRELFGDRPVVLALGYYRCPNLCSTLMQGILEALAASGLDPASYRVVEVGIDPAETPMQAAAREASYRAFRGGRDADLALLTGDAGDIAAVAGAVGFKFAHDASGEYAHPAGFIIATPKGTISRYFLGVRFDPELLRRSLTEAADGRVGSPVERLLLMCSHYDPSMGRYAQVAMTAVRGVSLLIFGILAGWMLRRRFRGGVDE